MLFRSHYHRALFPLRYYGPYSGSSPGNGPFRRAYDPFDYRNRRHQDPVDLCFFPSAQIPLLFIYFLSGFLDRYHCYAGGVLLLCAEAVYEADTPGSPIWPEVRAAWLYVYKNKRRFQKFLQFLRSPLLCYNEKNSEVKQKQEISLWRKKYLR